MKAFLQWWLPCPLVLFLMAKLIVVVEMAFFPSVLWTTTFDKFSTKCCCADESPGLFIKVPPSTKLYIVCPSEAIIFQKQESNVPSDLLHDNCIMVDEEGYDNCRYDPTKSPNTTKIIQNCTHNAKGPLQFRRLVFDKISIFDDLVFEPGRNYSFISTSDGTKDSLTNNQGPGRCNDAKNHLAMKMKIYVCKEDEDCSEPTYINMCEDKCAPVPLCAKLDANWDYCESRRKKCNNDDRTKAPTEPTKPVDLKNVSDVIFEGSNGSAESSRRDGTAPETYKILAIVAWGVAALLSILLIVIVIHRSREQSRKENGTLGAVPVYEEIQDPSKF